MNHLLSCNSLKIAFIIPCYNEELSIVSVIKEASQAIPEADIYVFDNNSIDKTVAHSLAQGARVINVKAQGKGNVVRRMFADVEADVYILVDGDATYDLTNVKCFVNTLLDQKLDMIVGVRTDDLQDSATYRAGHRLGNKLLTSSVKFIFGGEFSDMLSGYRVFSKRFVKSFPTAAQGFEIETDFTIHALALNMPYLELPVDYRSRPAGSHSKLSTYRDGFRILLTILKLFTIEKPLIFFSVIALMFSFASFGLASPLVNTYLETGLVPRLPTAILSTGMMICGFLSGICGIILNTVTIGRQEVKRLHYLSIPQSHK